MGSSLLGSCFSSGGSCRSSSGPAGLDKLCLRRAAEELAQRGEQALLVHLAAELAGELDYAGFGLGEAHLLQGLDRRRGGSQEAHVPQVVDAGLGVARGVGPVEARGDLLEAAPLHELGEGRLHLVRVGV